MARPGTRSLFWTLSGAFFGVLVLAVVLQWLVVVLVVEPVSRRWQQTRAERVAEQVANSLSDALADGRGDRIEPILRDVQSLLVGVRVFYVDANDVVFAFPEPPRGVRNVLPEVLRGEREMPRDWGRRRRGFDPPPSPDSPGPGEVHVAARAPVSVEGRVAGEVFVTQRPRRLSILEHVPERTLLFLPIALLVAGLAGLWIFLRLQRRLAHLESMASAIGEGNLEARVESPGSDEIGRLGRRLNEMGERLQRAREEIRASDDQRRQLLADITHELATPLTSIRGFTETLLDDDVPLDAEKREHYIANVLHAAERMDLLIRDLLDLARLEAGAGEFEFERIDLAALVRHSVERFAARFGESRLELAFEGSTAVPVQADGLRLEQVVDNLLVNALRYVPAGGRVEVETRVEGSRAVLTVRDDGPGVPPEVLPHLFDRFYRTDPSRSAGGSGLGLAIVREIVRRHGGEVCADSAPGRGLSLRIELPADASGA